MTACPPACATRSGSSSVSSGFDSATISSSTSCPACAGDGSRLRSVDRQRGRFMWKWPWSRGGSSGDATLALEHEVQRLRLEIDERDCALAELRRQLERQQ